MATGDEKVDLSEPGAASRPDPSVRVCAFACLKSTLSRIALAATSSVHERLTFPAPIGGFLLLRETPGLTCDLSPVIVSETSRKL
jgi:hypothetical protein